jgi:phage FluMu gp28-like protein
LNLKTARALFPQRTRAANPIQISSVMSSRGSKTPERFIPLPFRLSRKAARSESEVRQIDTESIQPFPGFVRSATKWWEIEAFCSDVAKAKKIAPQLTTKERVERFASERLKIIFANMVIEDFQQEYEAEYVDETTAWISWAEIQANTIPDLNCVISEDRKTIDNALIAIAKFQGLIQRNEIESVFVGGSDIGRTKHATEICLNGKSTVESYPLRLMLTLNECGFDDQFAVFCKILDMPQISKMLIDKTGLGIQLAESLEKKYSSKAEGVSFTNPSKELWATHTKMLFQQNKVPIPVNKDLAYQIHSIKKKVTASNNLVFDTDKNEKHHADKFWMLALALQAANVPARFSDYDETYEEDQEW